MSKTVKYTVVISFNEESDTFFEKLIQIINMIKPSAYTDKKEEF